MREKERGDYPEQRKFLNSVRGKFEDELVKVSDANG
jgi:hypothetical protein